MSDLISRQAAIDALKNRWKKTCNYEGIGDDIAEECELYLKQVPSAQTEQRWIPVSESLPDGRLNKSYLVQDKDGRRAVGTYTNWGWMFGHYMNDPVAWMPLPKPYERKEE